jgi:predicted lipoprotein with Yx(FWY)xxD motif
MKNLISLKARPVAAGLLMALALVIAACSPAPLNETQEPISPATGSETQEPILPDTGGGTIQVADHQEFGPILVNPEGMTLYTNTVDSPEDLRCINIACTGFWPPFTIDGEPAGGEDLPGSLGTVERPDGTTQVTYNEQPLYTFYLDNQPGDAKGEGFIDFGGTWHVISVEGSQ